MPHRSASALDRWLSLAHDVTSTGVSALLLRPVTARRDRGEGAALMLVFVAMHSLGRELSGMPGPWAVSESLLLVGTVGLLSLAHGAGVRFTVLSILLCADALGLLAAVGWSAAQPYVAAWALFALLVQLIRVEWIRVGAGGTAQPQDGPRA